MPKVLETIRKISELEKLPAGWRYGQGKAASAMAISYARQLNNYAAASGYVQTNVFLAENGGIQFVIYEDATKRDSEYEFNISPDGQIDFAHLVDGQDRHAEEELTLTSAKTKIDECARGLCDSYDSSTQTITTNINIVSEVLLSPHQTTAYLWSSGNVQKTYQVIYARTYTNSIQITSEALRRYSGKSHLSTLPC